MEGRILVINTGSTSTKIALYDSEVKCHEQNLVHSASELAKFNSVMDQISFRKQVIMEFLSSICVSVESIDLVMARGGLIRPVRTGVYSVNEQMKQALISCKDGIHASNLSAIIADEISDNINQINGNDLCKAYIADAPTADDLIDVSRITGLPEIPYIAVFHALNSRAMVRKYAKDNGVNDKDINVIVAHIGGGTSVSLHSKGRVIDTSDALGGVGAMSPERAGALSPIAILDECFSGKYSKVQIKKRLLEQGGAVAYFGTNDFKSLVDRALAGEKDVKLFIDAYCLSVSKYISSMAASAYGDVQAVIITGGIAFSKYISSEISKRIGFIAPVHIYPGENEIDALAENGYAILSGNFEVNTFKG